MISILIPFKNTQAYLNACLESILKQTYKDWEILAVDDCSTDNSKDIVEGYAKLHPNIHYILNTGNGIIPALQTGYRHAKGQFITRMDSDDIMVPYRLEVMVQSLRLYGHGHVAVGQVKYFSEEGISDGYTRYERWLNQLTAKGTNYTEIYKECVIPSPCWMVHKSDFEKCDAFNPTRYPEDYDLTFRFYANHLKVIPCKQVLHLWRDYGTRTSRTHEHYAQNYFLEIKLHYFLKLEYNTKRTLVIWGAGYKGKTIAKKLTKKNIPFIWVCDNPNKIGKHIYGTELQHFSLIESLEEPQSIITVANDKAQEEIRKFLSQQNQEQALDYFFFC
ncbi:glycosyltransferase family 2 protein [Croceivirga sp. JEA036]|uniref:glycosyltransferase family 2 protein n=1 Tax=Croceivirga sp. JEA036 TaxID=2721162 RepID=UPI00143B0DEB|nr:glycosyltransferase family 2 protein [Croceivirga sp. JEA036]NJB35523.1 glycosyltransferase family 2 protein [Croceivirga sp. JEA036]